MMKNPRNLLWLVPLAALLTMPLWKPFAADILSPEHRETRASVPTLTDIRGLISSAMNGVQFEQSKNGAREWLLTASRLYSKENDPEMQLEDVEGLFFGPAGDDEKTRIRSQKARYNTGTKGIILQGEVVIRDGQGYEMQTDSLEYFAAEKKIRTTTAVKIRGNNIEVSGNKLLYDTATGNYRLEGDVSCRMW